MQSHGGRTIKSDEVGSHREPTGPPVAGVGGIAIAVIAFVAMLIATYMTYLVALACVLGAIAGGVALYRSGEHLVGGGLVAGAVLSIVVLTPEWMSQRSNNQILDSVTAQTCNLRIPDVDILSCGGDLDRHGNNGNFCTLTLSMEVATTKSLNELQEAVGRAELPQGGERGHPDPQFEVLAGGDEGTLAAVEFTGGFVSDARC